MVIAVEMHAPVAVSRIRT